MLLKLPKLFTRFIIITEMCTQNLLKSAEHRPCTTKLNESSWPFLQYKIQTSSKLCFIVSGLCLAKGCNLHRTSHLHRDWFLPYFWADNIVKTMRVSVVPQCLVSQRFSVKLAHLSYNQHSSAKRRCTTTTKDEDNYLQGNTVVCLLGTYN
jgi:hypothetical protein